MNRKYFKRHFLSLVVSEQKKVGGENRTRELLQLRKLKFAQKNMARFRLNSRGTKEATLIKSHEAFKARHF